MTCKNRVLSKLLLKWITKYKEAKFSLWIAGCMIAIKQRHDKISQ